jgi:hypothetical protein
MNTMLMDNLFALSALDEELFSQLAGIKPSNRYVFKESRSGETVPSFCLQNGETLPLHSMVDPKREAQRLIETALDASQDSGFIIFLGLGGGFAPEAALEMTDARIIVIEYCIDNIIELFSSVNYTKLLFNSRFSLLADPTGAEIKNFILENYLPVLCGGIKTIPLRTRIEQDREKFEEAVSSIQEAIENVSSDYSVQAHFGLRMFSNIIRNIKAAESCENFFAEKKSKPIQEAAIVAAGPSLDRQLSMLAELKARGGFVISSDTALPVLLHNGIEPDTVVSIDCQHISSYHFFGCDLRNIPLVLDIASPPLLSRLARPVFFSSGHPLARYICAHWKPFVQLDTSGGNVTYACLSLAENLGAKNITLFGADFSYIRSQTYARGTYIYPYFYKKQNRLSPAEAQFSAFLYRNPFIPAQDGKIKNYYETTSLRFYRKKLEEKASIMTANISCAPGEGAPVNLQKAPNASTPPCADFDAKETVSGTDFLEQYSREIAALPDAKGTESYIEKLNSQERQVFATLLPYAAAIKKRNMELKREDLIEEVKRRSIKEIERTLTTPAIV